MASEKEENLSILYENAKGYLTELYVNLKQIESDDLLSEEDKQELAIGEVHRFTDYLIKHVEFEGQENLFDILNNDPLYSLEQIFKDTQNSEERASNRYMPNDYLKKALEEFPKEIVSDVFYSSLESFAAGKLTLIGLISDIEDNVIPYVQTSKYDKNQAERANLDYLSKEAIIDASIDYKWRAGDAFNNLVNGKYQVSYYYEDGIEEKTGLKTYEISYDEVLEMKETYQNPLLEFGLYFGDYSNVTKAGEVTNSDEIILYSQKDLKEFLIKNDTDGNSNNRIEIEIPESTKPLSFSKSLLNDPVSFSELVQEHPEILKAFSYNPLTRESDKDRFVAHHNVLLSPDVKGKLGK